MSSIIRSISNTIKRAVSSVGQSSRLISDWFRVRVPDGPLHVGVVELADTAGLNPAIEWCAGSTPAVDT